VEVIEVKITADLVLARYSFGQFGQLSVAQFEDGAKTQLKNEQKAETNFYH